VNAPTANITASDLVAASDANLGSIGYHFGSIEALLNETIGLALEELAHVAGGGGEVVAGGRVVGVDECLAYPRRDKSRTDPACRGDPYSPDPGPPEGVMTPLRLRLDQPGTCFGVARGFCQPLGMALSAHGAGGDGLVRRGLALEICTLAWVTVEAIVAVAAGLAAGSVALVAFGIDSVIEFAAALVVLQTLRAEQTGRAGRSEDRALRVIGVTFFLLAAYIVADAGYTLIVASKPESSVPGVAVTAAALVVMPVLSFLKRRTGSRLGSRMLLADAAESLFCAYLSATLLVGLVLNLAFGWWWADPLAALAVVPLVIKEGREAFEDLNETTGL